MSKLKRESNTGIAPHILTRLDRTLAPHVANPVKKRKHFSKSPHQRPSSYKRSCTRLMGIVPAPRQSIICSGLSESWGGWYAGLIQDSDGPYRNLDGCARRTFPKTDVGFEDHTT